MNYFFMLFSVLFLGFSGPNGVAAADENRILLTIDIQAADGSAGTVTQLTRDDLRALPPVTFDTNTNWTKGTHRFTGVALRALLDQWGVTDGEIELMAINGYSVVLPVDDPTNDGAILAYLMDGEPMSARDKGPVWMVYNYDSDRQYRTETVFSRSIWQLDRIIISR